jgi:CheY-like chemotaxis protein
VQKVVGIEKSFLSRSDVQQFVATTGEEALALHRANKVKLMIITLVLPGMACEVLCAAIRKDPALRMVSIMILCEDDASAVRRASGCGANAVLKLPIDAAQLVKQARDYLEIAWRESYRVLLRMNVEGNMSDKTFFCSSENISASGMLIETDKVIPSGSRIQCSFFLPDSVQIKTTGEVVRVMPKAAGARTARYGIKFLQLTSEGRAAIESFVVKKGQLVRGS